MIPLTQRATRIRHEGFTRSLLYSYRSLATVRSTLIVPPALTVPPSRYCFRFRAVVSNCFVRHFSDSRSNMSAPASNMSYIGSIDEGTSSTRFILFDHYGKHVASHQIELKQYYNEQPGCDG